MASEIWGGGRENCVTCGPHLDLVAADHGEGHHVRGGQGGARHVHGRPGEAQEVRGCHGGVCQVFGGQGEAREVCGEQQL